MRIAYGKLIRDRIPELMDADGVRYALATMDDGRYRSALLAKLLEEAQEVAEATSPETRAVELADLLEVIDAIVDLEGLDEDRVATLQRKRRAERGGFALRLELLWTEQ